MQRDATQPRVRRSSRLSAGPLYLAVGLAVLYAVLVIIVPAMERMNDVRARGTEGAAWQAALQRGSELVRAHTRGAAAIAGAGALVGLVLPLVLRPARYLVWFVALAVFLLDVSIVVAVYSSMLTRAIRDAMNGLGR